VSTIGFLHTSPVHVPTFDGLTRRISPGVTAVHVVDESLLKVARSSGPEAVLGGVRDGIDSLRERGAQVVVCTCSTIGDVAESAGTDVPTFRVDRPMARRAVDLGDRIGVVAALESTLAPTKALVVHEAAAAGKQPVIDLVLVDGAWDDFEADDMDGYLHRIADSARAIADRVDVIVLAQASMAPAVDHLGDLDVSVLSSPDLAVRYAVNLL
jgi:hypothetical protein